MATPRTGAARVCGVCVCWCVCVNVRAVRARVRARARARVVQVVETGRNRELLAYLSEREREAAETILGEVQSRPGKSALCRLGEGTLDRERKARRVAQGGGGRQ